MKIAGTTGRPRNGTKKTGTDALKDSLASQLLNRAAVMRRKEESYIDYIHNNLYIVSEEDEVIPFRMNGVQQVHYKRKQQAIKDGKPKKFMVLKYRRGGFTTFEQACSYAMICTRANTECLTLTQDGDATKKIFKMVKLMHTMNPRSPNIGTDTTTVISYPSMNSEFSVQTSGSGTVGRGSRLARVHGSEVAFWKLNYEGIQDLVAGLSEAARFGEMIFETTANGAKGWYYETFREAMAGENDWTALFYPWYEDPVNTTTHFSEEEGQTVIETLTDEEKEMIRMHDLTIDKLVWRRRKVMSLKKRFPQEYPANWQEAFIIHGTTFFSADAIGWHQERCSDPLHQRNGVTVWLEPEAGKQYVAGADCAEGIQTGDNSVCGILDRETGEQVARLKGKWRPEVFAQKSADLCRKYNTALLGVERNNHGHSVLNTLRNTIGYPRLYRQKEVLKVRGGRRTQNKVGWHTNSSTRPMLLDSLNEALEEKRILVNDRDFLNECKTFVDNGGRYEAANGEHDDLIMAWGIANAIRGSARKGVIL